MGWILLTWLELITPLGQWCFVYKPSSLALYEAVIHPIVTIDPRTKTTDELHWCVSEANGQGTTRVVGRGCKGCLGRVKKNISWSWEHLSLQSLTCQCEVACLAKWHKDILSVSRAWTTLMQYGYWITRRWLICDTLGWYLRTPYYRTKNIWWDYW
jgi:hypothetical protein